MKNLLTFEQFINESDDSEKLNFSLWYPRKPKNFIVGENDSPEAGKWFKRECNLTLVGLYVRDQVTKEKLIVCSPEFGKNPKKPVPDESEWPGDNPWEFVRVVSGKNKGLCWIIVPEGIFSDNPGTYEFQSSKGSIATEIFKPINQAPNVVGWSNSKGNIFNIKKIFHELRDLTK